MKTLTTIQMEEWLFEHGYHLYFESSNGITMFFVDEPTRESCIEGGRSEDFKKVIERAYRKAAK